MQHDVQLTFIVASLTHIYALAIDWMLWLCDALMTKTCHMRPMGPLRRIHSKVFVLYAIGTWATARNLLLMIAIVKLSTFMV